VNCQEVVRARLADTEAAGTVTAAIHQVHHHDVAPEADLEVPLVVVDAVTRVDPHPHILVDPAMMTDPVIAVDLDPAQFLRPSIESSVTLEIEKIPADPAASAFSTSAVAPLRKNFDAFLSATVV